MTKYTKEYWINSIRDGIESYLNYMIDGNIEEDVEITSKIPCLCVEEWPRAFQVIVTLNYKVDEDIPLVYNKKILKYEIPYQFVHGYTESEMKKVNEVIEEIIKEINDEF